MNLPPGNESPNRDEPGRSGQIQEENRKIRRARILVDLTQALILTDPHLERGEAYRLVDGLKTTLVGLFPCKGDVFDLVIRPRLERAIRSRFLFS